MDTTELRSKRVVIPAVVAVAALGIGGVAWAASADTDLRGNDRDRVGNAASEAVGGGTVTDVERSDDLGEAYEVEIRKNDGTEVDVSLDDQLNVIGQDADDVDDDDRWDDRDDRWDDRDDGDDRPLRASERRSAADAAAAEVGSGTVVDVEAGDDRGVAYEVEVLAADHTEWDIQLDASFRVIGKSIDD